MAQTLLLRLICLRPQVSSTLPVALPKHLHDHDQEVRRKTDVRLDSEAALCAFGIATVVIMLPKT